MLSVSRQGRKKKPTSDFVGQVHVTLHKFGGLVEWARKLSLSRILLDLLYMTPGCFSPGLNHCREC